MEICPIAYWKKHRSNAPAIGHLSYEELDTLVSKIASSLKFHESPILAFVPKGEILDCAFFFAAWRMGKSVYPLSYRLPEGERNRRLKFTGAKLVEPKLDEKPFADNRLDLTLRATLIETSSGTKIACHTLNALFAGAREALLALEIDATSTYCLNLPLFHISGIAAMLRTFLAGAHLVFEPTHASHLSMVPTQVLRLNQPLPKCKCLLVGGAPFNKREYEKRLLEGLPLYLTYGMTELGSMAALKKPFQKTEILPHVELTLAQDGEILVKGRSLFEGYFGGPKQEGWFATKDLGCFQDGELSIIGRKDRQFISGGENIQPEEIEAALRSIEGILEAHVTALKDPEFGEIPFARVFARKKISIDEMKRLLENQLPRFKIPKMIELSDHPLEGMKMASEPVGKRD